MSKWNFDTQGGQRDPANDTFGVTQQTCQGNAMWL